MNWQVQPTLFTEADPIDAAVERMAESEATARGAVFTRREVVGFILDLIGYTPERPVHRGRVLEPSFGGGDFLLPVASRLVAGWRAAGGEDAGELRDSLRAVELHRATFLSTRDALRAQLVGDGISDDAADDLLATWLVNGDFLLTPLHGAFDYVVGNPPYVRQEMIAAELLAEYRRRYRTLYDRADLYVPFIERSLASLSRAGTLGFICADRWMKNQYGGPLREMVARGYRLNTYVDMVDTPAFTSDVIAYPAITVISRGPPGPTRVAYRPKIDRDGLADLSRRLLSPTLAGDEAGVNELSAVTAGKEPWILHGSDQLELVRRLEGRWPTIEAAGCEIGIGVATGADAAFIGPFDALDVEADRKLPLVMTRDIASGVVNWRGLGVVNPFNDRGGVVDLAAYPRLGRYLEARRDVIARRHVAAKTPAAWYRTIDRIHPMLAARPKLLIPDIKGEAHVVYEDGNLYPHHNLYFVTSADWDLRALQAVLVSGIAKLFVAAYSTKMRGGFLRFQAQYLRRIRLPEWSDVDPRLKGQLVDAAAKNDRVACNRTVFDLYGLTDGDRELIGRDGDGNGT